MSSALPQLSPPIRAAGPTVYDRLNTVLLVLILGVLIWQAMQKKPGRFLPNPGDDLSAIDTQTGRYCLTLSSSSGKKLENVPYCWELP
jgi:hypothetical protein